MKLGVRKNINMTTAAIVDDWELEPDEWKVVVDKCLTFDCGCTTDCGTTMTVEFDGNTQMITVKTSNKNKISFILPDGLLLIKKNVDT